MLNLLFGVGLGFGAALIGVGLFYKRLLLKPETPVQGEDCSELEYQIVWLNETLQAKNAELETAKRESMALQSELMHLQAWVREALNTPTYAVLAQAHDREAVARQLYYVENWSKRRIMRHLWGDVGGYQYKKLSTALALPVG